ncbi:asparagine--tRNA ligase [archaeon BMS3Bbin16]|nr:asparagine--tRNA ligase [archaeon BMS3Bbin16]
MMDRSYSDSLTPEMEGTTVTIAGWVHEIRGLGKLRFLLIRDGRGIVQVTLPKKFVPEEAFAASKEVSKESVVRVRGKVQREDRAPKGIEILPEEIEIISLAVTPLPLDPTGKVDANLDTRLDHRVIDLRRANVAAIFKARTTALRAGREYLESQGFSAIKTPRIISTASEGGTELFPLAYFDREAFLAQSPQLYKQMMMGTGLDRVYELATYFRAEEHDTVSHLNEVSAIDCEMSFIDSESEVMDIVEGLTLSMIEGVRKNCQPQLEVLGIEIDEPKTPFPRLEYIDVIDMLLSEENLRVPFGEDLNTEAEKALGRIMERRGHKLYFITKYPLDIKPFYTMPDSTEPTLSNSFDLEFMGREIVSGSQRIHNYDLLTERIVAKDMDPDGFGAYLEAFRFGMPPHGGFGMGIERFLMLLLNLSNIRETVLFPRDRHRLTP